jgi:dCMP deaminase
MYTFMSGDIIAYLDSYDETKSGRLPWGEYFICIAKLISLRSPSSKLKVGAVIVSDNRIISVGYNGFFAGSAHIPIEIGGHEVNTVHAEQNAIADAAKRGVSINNAEIHITHYPCINCAKLIIASGIRTIRYLTDYKNDPIVERMFVETKVDIRKSL